MKRFIRTTIALAMLWVYAGCQKEVADVIPVDNPTPTDSTSTDSTITTIRDSLKIVSFSPDSGRIGIQVQIIGSGFDTVASRNLVLINTTAVKIISATKTRLTVQVQEGTTGKISVAANGKAAQSLTDFVVLKDSIITDSTVSGKNAWTRKADPPSIGNTFITGFSISGKGYLFGGWGIVAYDPVTNTWSGKAGLPDSVTKHTFGFCFIISNKAYVGLVANYDSESFEDEENQDQNYQAVWEYDATQDKWTQKANFPGVPRVMPFSFAFNGLGYVGGGDTTNDNFGKTHDFWKYDPARDKWTRLNDFPGNNSVGFTGFSLGAAGYVLEAGQGIPIAPVSGPYSEVLWKYNPASDTWEKKAPLPINNHVSAVVFTIGNKAYAAVGIFPPENMTPVEKADFWEYDPMTNKWTKKADVGGGVRLLSTGFAVGGKGYVGLGTGDYYEDLKADFWEYTPE